MFCTAHRSPRPIPVIADQPKAGDRRVRQSQHAAPRHIFTDWAAI